MDDNHKRFLRIPQFSSLENIDCDEISRPRGISFSEECSDIFRINNNDECIEIPKNSLDGLITPKFNGIETFDHHKSVKSEESIEANIDEYIGGVGHINFVKDSLSIKTIVNTRLTSDKMLNEPLNLSDSIDTYNNYRMCSRNIACQCIIT